MKALKWIGWAALIACGPFGWALMALWYARKLIRLLDGSAAREAAEDAIADAQAKRDWAEGKAKFASAFEREWARQEERRAYPNGRPNTHGSE